MVPLRGNRLEIDHIFICSKYKGPEGDMLVDFGLVEGSSNTHPGQGTANRRFFFHNVMLELLWIEDLTEAQSPLTKTMRLYERCIEATEKVCPFGIDFRPTKEQQEAAPFTAWDYQSDRLVRSVVWIIKKSRESPCANLQWF